MDISLPHPLIAVLLLFVHLVGASLIALVAYAVMSVIRLQPDIRYLFWPAFIGGGLAWLYTTKKLLTSQVPFHWWADSALFWYAILAIGGVLVGIFIQRSRL